jgi:hypothetical protein
MSNSRTLSNSASIFTISGGANFTSNVSVNGQFNVNYRPTSTVNSAIVIIAANTKGGTGYADILQLTNSSGGATTPNKYIRLNSTGNIEIINSTYEQNIFELSDTGSLNLPLPLKIDNKQALNGPTFRAYVSVGQTITSGSQQKVTFGTENFDTNNNFASSRFTPTVEGYYQFNAVVRLDGNSGTGEFMLVLYKNGQEYARGTNQQGTQIASNYWSQSISDIAYANGTGDYFEIYIQQSDGIDKTTTAGSSISHFSGCMIRGA